MGHLRYHYFARSNRRILFKGMSMNFVCLRTEDSLTKEVNSTRLNTAESIDLDKPNRIRLMIGAHRPSSIIGLRPIWSDSVPIGIARCSKDIS